MKNQAEIQKRFLKEDSQMRLGHLASDLARITSLVEMRAKSETIKNVVEESKFFCEWAVHEVEPEIKMFLANIQSFLSLAELEWNSLFHDTEWQERFARQSKIWSHELLAKAGLIDSQSGRCS